ncbi:kinase-like domain-containing protein [Cladochytrium replicatum]|nr:kinase-like domain-containing protein [Cladochytrium replicatum]
MPPHAVSQAATATAAHHHHSSSSHHNQSARKQPNFGPYRLGKTIGEGEFGKVKLAVHTLSGKELAIKLIKKESLENGDRGAKLLREISILQSVSHPFIVKLYEVIETDQYIGMVMEYASGGELFEHILAHRYLREKDACRFFAQLIAGVHYLHHNHIVHRDLKLENLLLDSHRNIVITDFGFANRSIAETAETQGMGGVWGVLDEEGDPGVLLTTSCGSPCYAAPELVISDGYVGEAADIWSCGVILYAMLCGYLPFDDDPANPEGDNINLLYKYILETELEFPDYVSNDARSMLRKMLVPDPKYRAKMKDVMSHRCGDTK